MYLLIVNPLAGIIRAVSLVVKSLIPVRLIAGVVLTHSLTVVVVLAQDTTMPAGLTLQLNPATGTYTLEMGRVNWAFAGTFNGPFAAAITRPGNDAVGSYEQTSFSWRDGHTPMTGFIRIYREQAQALFSQTCGAAMDLPPTAFPDFNKIPAGLHVFSHGLKTFAPPQFTANESSTPWLLFDDLANACIISPASHFMVTSMFGDGQSRVASGFNTNLCGLPAGFTQTTLVAFGQGINRTWQSWGRAMLELQSAKRPAYDADIGLKYLGYWTDNGAGYYYNYDADKGYTGTLAALVARYRQEQIPIHYLQLDSWWYYKTTTNPDGSKGGAKKSAKLPTSEWNRYGGTLEYTAHKDLFPNGLGAFEKSVGLPLITHARWIDPDSSYRKEYKSSGLVIVDPLWWNSIAAYLKTSGVITYEQDWLDRIYKYSPAFSSNMDTAEAFLDNMSRSCLEQGITLQYCMPYAAHFMQGSRYPNLTTIRTSDDRFSFGHWNDFIYTSQLAASLGIWPWTDVFKSTETGNVLIATLSAGPVGIGDLIGAETKTNIMQATRADGVIVKPDAPLVPLDCSYIADAQKKHAPLIASTHTQHGEITTTYIVAVNRPKTEGGDVKFNLSDLNMIGPAYVFNYFTGAGEKLVSDGTFTAFLGKTNYVFYVVAPVGPDGIAFLGDRDKFVGTGNQRIANLNESADHLTVEVMFAENEEAVTLHGYAGHKPTVSVTDGISEPIDYDSSTCHFSVKIISTGSVDRSGADPVRHLTVTFKP
jgi:hypothetical protein